MRINEKQERFAVEYMIDFNGEKAAIRAGYAKKGACQNASRLLRNDKVKAKLLELKKAVTKRNDLTLDKVINEIQAIAFSDIRKLYSDTGRLLEPYELDDITAKTVSSFKQKQVIVKDGEDFIIDEYKTYDKPKSLDMLMEYFKDGKDETPQAVNIIYNVIPKK